MYSKKLSNDKAHYDTVHQTPYSVVYMNREKAHIKLAFTFSAVKT